MDDLRQAAFFCLVPFAAAYLMEVCVWLTGGLMVWFAPAVLVAVIFVPLLSTVMIVKLVEHGSLRSYGIAKGRVKHYLFSLAYPFAVVALGLLFVAILGTAPIDFTMTKARGYFRTFLPRLRFPGTSSSSL